MAKLEMPDFFSLPLREIESLSPDFIQRAEWMGYSSIKEIIETKEKKLMSNIYFNMIWFNELLDYLNQYKLLDIMDDDSRF